MPINANPEYQKAERSYHEARTISEKIKALQLMLQTCPKHKGSENLQNDIKQKISKLKKLQDKQKSAGSRFTISVKKEGAAQVVIIGVPNSGKSTLLTKLTNAKPEIAPYPFTTKLPEVGIMDYDGIKIQIVEIPALFEGFSTSEMGPTFLGIVRQADLILIIANKEKELDLIKNELANSNIIIDKKRPKIKIKKNNTGGLMFVGDLKGDLNKAKKILRNHNIHNATVEFEEKVDLDELEEVLTEGIAYVYSIIINTQNTVEEIKKKIWSCLGLIRVFTKQPGKKREYPPIALKKGDTVKDLAKKIHKDFLKKFKFARIWGTSVKFQGAQSGLNTELHDLDVVEFHTK